MAKKKRDRQLARERQARRRREWGWVWLAECESCGHHDDLHPQPMRGEFVSPCLWCGSEFGRAVERAA